MLLDKAGTIEIYKDLTISYHTRCAKSKEEQRACLEIRSTLETWCEAVRVPVTVKRAPILESGPLLRGNNILVAHQVPRKETIFLFNFDASAYLERF